MQLAISQAHSANSGWMGRTERTDGRIYRGRQRDGEERKTKAESIAERSLREHQSAYASWSTSSDAMGEREPIRVRSGQKPSFGSLPYLYRSGVRQGSQQLRIHKTFDRTDRSKSIEAIRLGEPTQDSVTWHSDAVLLTGTEGTDELFTERYKLSVLDGVGRDRSWRLWQAKSCGGLPFTLGYLL